MSEPHMAAQFPAGVRLEAGKMYSWCACGLSQKQPFCDGHHKDTEFKPVLIPCNEPKTVYLCQCKRTKNPPYCDGTHKKL